MARGSCFSSIARVRPAPTARLLLHKSGTPCWPARRSQRASGWPSTTSDLQGAVPGERESAGGVSKISVPAVVRGEGNVFQRPPRICSNSSTLDRIPFQRPPPTLNKRRSATAIGRK